MSGRFVTVPCNPSLPPVKRFRLGLLFLATAALVSAQAPGASRITPNLQDNIDRPLRYRPEGADFVIENGAEFFNRPLYGGNTAFRVDGGDKPEFVLYLPGRGGNLRLGVAAGGKARWLHNAARILTRYRPGELLYEIRDPLLGPDAVLQLTALAYPQTEGLLVRAVGENVADGVELIWAYGGVNGQRGKRDGDIGTENVPISQWFQLQPAFAAGNTVETGEGTFTVKAKNGSFSATLAGVAPAGAKLRTADATQWNDPLTLLNAQYFAPPREPLAVGRVAIANQAPLLLSVQRLATDASAEDLSTYKEVTADRPGVNRAAPKFQLAPAYAAADLPRLFDAAEKYYATLRNRVSVDTPDPFLNAAVGALNVAADAVWDEPDHAIMHGAIAWRTKLLGWRGPYSLDALGWHERAKQHFTYWAGRQNQDPIPPKLPPADENANLARSEAGLHSNGDMSNSHYDMNLVFVDAFFRHLRWTGDLEFARQMWPTIERHLAWEQRLFRREFGPDGAKLPLYEAYAAIWASDDLHYDGGGAMHASAYNYFHNQQAARLARLLKLDPTIYQREAQLLERGMREHLWLEDRGWFAESKDLLGLQRVHPAAALWTFYHTLDSEVPNSEEAWRMTRQVDTQIPHLPVRGPGVPAGFYTLGTSTWMPYHWSINNVVMGEAVHAALGYWLAGRPEEAWKIAKGSLLAAMFMGISPGNVGSMSYLDVYRRESQRDFADGSGVLSRTLVEGLFGVRPDALAGELRVEPGFPMAWERASLKHPDIAFSFQRQGGIDSYEIDQRFAKPMALRLRVIARRERIAAVTVNGQERKWFVVPTSVGAPRIDILAPPMAVQRVVIRWEGAAPGLAVDPDEKRPFAVVEWKGLKWLEPVEKAWALPPTDAAPKAEPVARDLFVANQESVDLAPLFNDRVTQIFKHEYRAPRSPFVSLALPKQGLGGWAGGVNETAEIDDRGLRAAAGRNGGRVALPNGLQFATPGPGDANNVVFTSQWDNFPREKTIPLTGRAQHLYLLMAGSTGPMQSRFENGELVVTYADGTVQKLALENPTNWWPIEQDYFIDDFQFRLTGPLPTRVDLRSGQARVLDAATFKGRGGRVPGGAATVLELPLKPDRELKALTVRATANEVVIGLMAATLIR